MKFGLLLHTQSHRSDAATMVPHALEQARIAERSGWDLVLAGQHFAPDPYAMLQPMPLLGHLAARTQRIGLGTAVLLVPHLRPIQVAEELVTLDHLCGGRLVAGFGSGYRRVERQLFGVPDRGVGERFEQHVEQIIDLLEGRVVPLPGSDEPGVRLALRAVQQPRPPIWMAASSGRALARVARRGASWLTNPHIPLPELRRQAVGFREVSGATGGIVLFREGLIAEQARDLVGPLRDYLLPKYRQYDRWGLPGMSTVSETAPVEIDEDRFIGGDPAACLRQVESVARTLRLDTLVLRMQWPGMPHRLALEAIELFGDSVISAFKRSQRR